MMRVRRLAVLVVGGSAAISGAMVLTSGVALGAPVPDDFDGESTVIVIDTSNSMEGEKLSIAKEAAHAVTAAEDPDHALGLRSLVGVDGGRSVACAHGGELLSEVELDNRAEIAAAIDGLTVGPWTPIPSVLRAAIGDLPSGGIRRAVLISDGESTCGPACDTAREFVDEGIDVEIFAIGFAIPIEARDDLECIAATTGGRYFEAVDLDSLTDALSRAVAGESRPPALTSIVPARLAETRTGSGPTTVDGLFAGIGPLRAGSTLELTVAGRGGVAAGARAAFLNVTAIRPAASGFLTVFPCGTRRPTASNVNYTAGLVVANAVMTGIGTGGNVCIYTLATTHLAVDVNGFAAMTSATGTLTPARLVETRSGAGLTTIDGVSQGIGRRTGGFFTRYAVAERGGVPGIVGPNGLVDTSAQSVFLNVTAIGPLGPGFLTVYPCGPRPNASNVNYSRGQVVPNAVIATMNDDGEVCIHTSDSTDYVVDVNGYVPPDGSLGRLEPARLAESRSGPGLTTVDGLATGFGRGAAGTTQLVVAGRGGVPANASAGFFNVTAVRPATAGFLTIYPCGEPRPVASNVNYRGGEVVPNAVLSKIGTGGRICIYSSAATDLVVDVNAFLPAD